MNHQILKTDIKRNLWQLERRISILVHEAVRGISEVELGRWRLEK